MFVCLKVDGVIFKFISKRKFVSFNLVLIESVSSWIELKYFKFRKSEFCFL
jgi:hypothetical protein